MLVPSEMCVRAPLGGVFSLPMTKALGSQICDAEISYHPTSTQFELSMQIKQCDLLGIHHVFLAALRSCRDHAHSRVLCSDPPRVREPGGDETEATRCAQLGLGRIDPTRAASIDGRRACGNQRRSQQGSSGLQLGENA